MHLAVSHLYLREYVCRIDGLAIGSKVAVQPSYLVSELVVLSDHLRSSADVFLASDVLKRGHGQGEETLPDRSRAIEIASPTTESVIALVNKRLRLIPVML